MSHDVYVVRYVHRHDSSIEAYATEAQARKARADIALTWAHELPNEDDAVRIKELYEAGEYDAAVSLYLEGHSSESIDLDAVTVYGSDAGVRVVDEKANVTHHARLLPTATGPGVSACGRMFWWTSAEVTFPVGTQNMKVWLPKDQPPLSCLSCICAEVE